MAQRPFGFDKIDDPEIEAFVQWKGTDVCMDLICECGHHNHYDGEFAYVVRCGGCGQLWEMPWHIYPRKSQRDDGMIPLDPNGVSSTPSNWERLQGGM